MHLLSPRASPGLGGLPVEPACAGLQVCRQRARARSGLGRPESLGAGRLDVAHACLGPVVATGSKAADLARARAAAKG